MTQKGTIAVVDDDESCRKAMARLIGLFGYTVLAFASADEFLMSGQVEDSACIITDIRMPGMSGIALHKLLRAEGYGMPVIFVTADPQLAARTETVAPGSLGVLTKPFGEQQLMSFIERALASTNCDFG